MTKERIDVLLVQKGLMPTREKAQKTIMAGIVFVDGERVDKPGTKVPVESAIEIRGNVIPYVSRGGLKLEKAMRDYALSLEGKVCMDIGASTGGFTDCMLQNGALKVFSVDVGYGQLDWKLRNDDRVVNMERTNIRYVTPEQIGEALDFASIDVSFISLRLVLPVAVNLMREGGEVVFLIKPQFEAGREHMRKSGVLRDAKVHAKVLDQMVALCQTLPLELMALTYSPIKGPKGNIEFLGYARKVSENASAPVFDVQKLVAEAHESLK